MSKAMPQMRRNPASLRNTTIVAGSVLLHVIVLGMLASRALGIDFTDYGDPLQDPGFRNVIDVQLARRPARLPGQELPLHRSDRAANAARAPDVAGTSYAPEAAPFRDPTAVTRPPLEGVRLAPTGLRPSEPLPPPPRIAPAGPTDPWRVRQETGVPNIEPSAGSNPGSNSSPNSGSNSGPNGRLSRSLRLSPSGCRAMAGRLSPEDQAVCDTRMASAAARASAIIGTGNPERDAQLAADGAYEIAGYEKRRAALKPNSRAAACPGSPNPSDPCAVAIQGRIWSSLDGWMADLPGRRR